MIRAVLFDLDDTLYDESSYVRSGFLQVALQISGAAGLDAQTVFRFMLAELERSGRGRVFDATLQQFGLPVTPEAVAELVACYRTHRPAIELHADAARCLQSLQRVFVAVVTDGLPVMQRNKVAALGLEARVQSVVYCWALQRPKPDPAGFRQALAQLGVEAAEALIVGDRPDHDMAAAAALGVPAVRVRRGRFAKAPEGPWPAVSVVDDLQELADWINKERKRR